MSGHYAGYCLVLYVLYFGMITPRGGVPSPVLLKTEKDLRHRRNRKEL